MSESLHTNQTPASGDVNNGAAITTGGTFTFAVDGTVTAIRFWVPATNTGTYTVALYQVTADDDDPPAGGTGTLLASASASAGSLTAGQFNQVAITPVPVDTTHFYRAAIHSSSGRIVASGGFFSSAGLTNGNITAIQTGAGSALGTLRNGTFNEGASLAYPSSTFNGTDYFADVVFDEDAGPQVASAGRLQAGGVGSASARKVAVSAGRLQAGAVLSQAGGIQPPPVATYQRPAQQLYARPATLVFKRG